MTVYDRYTVKPSVIRKAKEETRPRVHVIFKNGIWYDSALTHRAAKRKAHQLNSGKVLHD